VSIDPPQVTLESGGSQQFTATVTGATNTAVTWSMNPVNGTLSATGMYTAPASVQNPTSVAITATAVAAPTASATATATITPSPISIVVNPPGATLSAGQTQQFAAHVTGSSNTAVTWSLAPAVGTLSSTGLYTAPATFTATQTVTITATSAADVSQSATAKIVLVPPGQYSVSYTVSGSAVTVSWTAPSGQRAKDWIGLSSPGAPNYWYTWSQGTSGATTGSIVVNLPTSPGLWEFRYYLGSNNYVIAATSAALPVSVTGFSVTATPATLAAGASLTVNWTAPAGRPAGDAISLFTPGKNNDLYPRAVQYVSGSGGTFTIKAPQQPGQYQLRYLLTGGGWVAAAIGNTVTVQ
jgi:hypothetical protein